MRKALKVHVVDFSVYDTEETICQIVAGHNNYVSEIPILVTIRGYENDPRELHEIPEVRTFCQRLIRCNFLAYMLPMPEQRDEAWAHALTGVELFLIAENASFVKRKNGSSMATLDTKKFLTLFESQIMQRKVMEGMVE